MAVKAKVFTIGGFSAHADQDDLLEWVSHFESKPEVFLVHGEAVASEALARQIEERFHMEVHVPRWMERLVLKPREVIVEEPAEEEVPPNLQTEMLNRILDLENELKLLRKRIKPKEAQERIAEDDIDRIRYVHEELQAILSGFQDRKA